MATAVTGENEPENLLGETSTSDCSNYQRRLKPNTYITRKRKCSISQVHADTPMYPSSECFSEASNSTSPGSVNVSQLHRSEVLTIEPWTSSQSRPTLLIPQNPRILQRLKQMRPAVSRSYQPLPKNRRARRTHKQLVRKHKCDFVGCHCVYASDNSLQQHIRRKHPSYVQATLIDDGNVGDGMPPVSLESQMHCSQYPAISSQYTYHYRQLSAYLHSSSGTNQEHVRPYTQCRLPVHPCLHRIAFPHAHSPIHPHPQTHSFSQPQAHENPQLRSLVVEANRDVRVDILESRTKRTGLNTIKDRRDDVSCGHANCNYAYKHASLTLENTITDTAGDIGNVKEQDYPSWAHGDTKAKECTHTCVHLQTCRDERIEQMRFTSTTNNCVDDRGPAVLQSPSYCSGEHDKIALVQSDRLCAENTHLRQGSSEVFTSDGPHVDNQTRVVGSYVRSINVDEASCRSCIVSACQSSTTGCDEEKRIENREADIELNYVEDGTVDNSEIGPSLQNSAANTSNSLEGASTTPYELNRRPDEAYGLVCHNLSYVDFHNVENQYNQISKYKDDHFIDSTMITSFKSSLPSPVRATTTVNELNRLPDEADEFWHESRSLVDFSFTSRTHSSTQSSVNGKDRYSSAQDHDVTRTHAQYISPHATENIVGMTPTRGMDAGSMIGMTPTSRMMDIYSVFDLPMMMTPLKTPLKTPIRTVKARRVSLISSTPLRSDSTLGSMLSMTPSRYVSVGSTMVNGHRGPVIHANFLSGNVSSIEESEKGAMALPDHNNGKEH